MTLQTKNQIRAKFDDMVNQISDMFDLPSFKDLELIFNDSDCTHYFNDVISFNYESYKRAYNRSRFNEYVKVATRVQYPYGYIKLGNTTFILTSVPDEFTLIHEITHALLLYHCDYDPGDSHGKLFAQEMQFLLNMFKPDVISPFPSPKV